MKPLYAIALALFFLTGCAPRSAYIPVTHNIPQFDTVKKLHSALYVSGNHVEIQASGNPMKHVAVSADLNFGSGIAVYDLALGWYGYSRDCRWHYAAMAGIGYNSNLYFRDPNSSGWFTRTRNGYDILSLYNRYYLQPSLSFEDDFGKDLWVFEPALTHIVQRGPLAVIVQLQSISPYSEAIDVRNTKFSPGLLLSTGFRYTLSGKRRMK